MKQLSHDLNVASINCPLYYYCIFPCNADCMSAVFVFGAFMRSIFLLAAHLWSTSVSSERTDESSAVQNMTESAASIDRRLMFHPAAVTFIADRLGFDQSDEERTYFQVTYPHMVVQSRTES